MSPSAPTASPVAGLRKERPGWAEILHLPEQPRVGVGGRGAVAAGVRGPNKQGGARRPQRRLARRSLALLSAAAKSRNADFSLSAGTLISVGILSSALG